MGRGIVSLYVARAVSDVSSGRLKPMGVVMVIVVSNVHTV